MASSRRTRSSFVRHVAHCAVDVEVFRNEMPSENLYRFISASVIPVVIISACGLLVLAFYNRLAYIVSRLRSFAREQLQEQERYTRECNDTAVDKTVRRRRLQWIEMLQAQTVRVSRRARLIQRTLLCLLGTIAALTVCSLALGVSVLWPHAVYVATPCFVLGAVLLLVAVILAMWEMKAALEPTERESEFIKRLAEELSDPPES